MKAKYFLSVLVVMFAIGFTSSTLKAESMIISNTAQVDNTIETTYFKGESETSLAPFKKVVKIQDEQGVCVSEITYVWGSKQKNWVPSEKLDYTYEGEKVMKVDLSAWDKKDMAWDLKESMDYNFDRQ